MAWYWYMIIGYAIGVAVVIIFTWIEERRPLNETDERLARIDEELDAAAEEHSRIVEEEQP